MKGTIQIKRNGKWVTFEGDYNPKKTITEVIKELNSRDHLTDVDGNPEKPIEYNCKCNAGYCGVCAMVVNGIKCLPCATVFGDVGPVVKIEPISKSPLSLNLTDIIREKGHNLRIDILIQIIFAILGIGLFALFLFHTILCVPSLIIYAYIPWSSIIGTILYILVFVHAVLGILYMITFMILRKKDKIQGKITARTVTLICAGIFIIALSIVHKYSFGYTLPTGEFVLAEPTLTMFLVNVILTIAIAIHSNITLQNSCISLGFCTNSNKKAVNLTTNSIAWVCGAVGIVSYIIYYIPGILGSGMWI